MNEVEKSYLAGIIDGEGTITLVRNGEFRYPSLTFCNNDKAILDYVQSFCPAVITVKKSTNENYHDNFVWKLEHRRAIDIIQQILPYMHETKKVKRAQSIIDNYIKLTPRNGRYSDELCIKKHQWEEDFFQL